MSIHEMARPVEDQQDAQRTRNAELMRKIFEAGQADVSQQAIPGEFVPAAPFNPEVALVDASPSAGPVQDILPSTLESRVESQESVKPNQETETQPRLMVRIARRIATLAENAGTKANSVDEKWSNRRTVRETAKDRVEASKQSVRQVGAAIVGAANRADQAAVVNVETAKYLGKTYAIEKAAVARERKDSLMTKLRARADRSKEQARTVGRVSKETAKFTGLVVLGAAVIAAEGTKRAATYTAERGQVAATKGGERAARVAKKTAEVTKTIKSDTVEGAQLVHGDFINLRAKRQENKAGIKAEKYAAKVDARLAKAAELRARADRRFAIAGQSNSKAEA